MKGRKKGGEKAERRRKERGEKKRKKRGRERMRGKVDQHIPLLSLRAFEFKQ